MAVRLSGLDGGKPGRGKGREDLRAEEEVFRAAQFHLCSGWTTQFMGQRFLEQRRLPIEY